MYHYVYEVINLITDMRYIGSRSCKIQPSQDLGNKYFTSSKDINFINDQRLNSISYKYVVLKEFENRKDALEFEIFLHNKFDVSRNNQFFNRAKQTSTGFNTSGKNLLTEEQRLIRSERWKKNNPNNNRDSSGSNNPMYESHRYGDKNPFFNKKHSVESKNKIGRSNSAIGIYKDKDGNVLRLFVSDYLVMNKEVVGINDGRKMKIKICPYCSKRGGAQNMKRYHFDNCKLK